MRNLFFLIILTYFILISLFIELKPSYQPICYEDAKKNMIEYKGYISLFECSYGFILINFDLTATYSNLTEVIHSFGYFAEKENNNEINISRCRFIFE